MRFSHDPVQGPLPNACAAPQGSQGSGQGLRSYCVAGWAVAAAARGRGVVTA
jgi:hypothetical protein